METNIKNSGTEEYEIKQPVREGRHVLPGAVKLLRRSELEQENSQGDIWCFGWQGDSESLYVDQIILTEGLLKFCPVCLFS